MSELLEKASHIRLLVLDVDGILTTGLLYYDHEGNEIKSFHIQDGLGIKLLQQMGIQVAIISGKTSTAVEKRMHTLGIEHLHLGVEHKLPFYQKIKAALQLEDKQIAYMGDDVIDLPILIRAGFSITVPEAIPIIKQKVDYITKKSGGLGAVREICDKILQAQGLYDVMLESYLTLEGCDE